MLAIFPPTTPSVEMAHLRVIKHNNEHRRLLAGAPSSFPPRIILAKGRLPCVDKIFIPVTEAEESTTTICTDPNISVP